MIGLKLTPRRSDMYIWLGSGVIAAIFILSGITKAYEPEIFIANAEKYRIVDGKMLLFVGAWLPWIEIMIGCCMLQNRTMREACHLAIILLLIFSCAQLSVVVRGLNTPCGCFVGIGAEGEDSDRVSHITILRTVGIAVVVGIVIALQNLRQRQSLR